MDTRKRKAFTILELLVVVAILAIIAVIAIPRFADSIERSRDARELAEINSVTKAVSAFYVDNGYYPTLQGDQPTYGDPKNIRFASIWPKYLSSLPHFSYWWVDETGKVIHTKSSIASIEENILTIANSSKQPVTYKAITTNPDKTVTIKTYTSGTIELAANTVVEIVADKTGETLFRLNSKFNAPLQDPNDPNYGAKAPKAVLSINPSEGLKTNTKIEFNSSGSTTDGKLSISNRQWKLNGTLLPDTDKRLEKVISAPGNYNIELRIQDSAGVWSEWVSKTFVIATDNKEPTASFTMNPATNITNDTEITFTDTSSDPDGDTLTKLWYIDGVARNDNPSGKFNVGTHSIYLTVTDPAGLSGTSSTTTFTVIAANHAPTAVISVTPNTGITNETNIIWNYALSTDADGDNIVAAEWQLDLNPIVYSAPNGLLTAGDHTMKLRVKDSKDAWSEWVSTTITVSSLLNQQLTTVDTAKWTRYDDTNAGIRYIGSVWTAVTADGNYNSTVHTMPNNPCAVTNSVEFSFYGTKLRIIGTQHMDFTTDLALFIDGQKVQTNSVQRSVSTKQVLNLEAYGLTLGTHTVSIHAVNDASRWNLDAIDIGKDGYLITPVQDRYLSGGYVSLSSTSTFYSPSSMGKFTLEAWVRRPSIPSSGICEIMATAEDGGYELFVNNAGYLYMSLHVGGGYKYVDSNGSMPINQWIHVASTFDGQYMRMYINGVLKNTTSVSGAVKDGSYLAIGANPPDMRDRWNADLSNVRIWNVARTAQQIKDNMYTTLSGNETGLIGYWKLNESSGTTARDSSPSKKDGTVISGTWKQ